MTKPVSLAVVSDLHIGSKACTPELQNIPSKGHSEFLKQFEQFVEREKIKPDYLLLPGDFGEVSDPYEFDSASALLQSLAEILGVEHSKIYMSPGNHDVDWAVLRIKTPAHPVRMKQRYDPIRNPVNIFHKLLSQAKGTLFDKPHCAVWRNKNVFCASYNSSWSDGPESKHHGVVDLDDLKQIRSNFEDMKVEAFDGLKVFLVHHHIFQHAQMFWEDTSIAQNAEALIDLLNHYKFDLLVHGHRHWPKFFVLRKNELHPLVILGAGTFSREIDPANSGQVANQFHMIDINGRNGSGAVYGRVRSWAYLRAAGWVMSSQSQEFDPTKRLGQGISHIKPFGGYGSETELSAVLRPKILSALSGSQNIIELSSIVGTDIRFDHATEELVEATLRTLGKELGFTHISAATAGNVIMLKKV